MSDISQIIANSLLSNINRTNTNNRSLLGANPNPNPDSFDRILNSTLNSLGGDRTSGGCSCGGNNNNLSQLLMLTTMIGILNSGKLDISQNNSNANNNVTNSNAIDENIDTNNNVNNTNAVNNVSKPSNQMDKAIKLLEDQIGKPYVWGANGPNSFDCSGLVRYVYKNALGKDIPRVSYDQSKFGKAVEKKDLQPGDLVFFDTMNKGRVSHVGMYIGNDEFIHASNPRDGVKKSKLSSSYYQKAYEGARRP